MYRLIILPLALVLLSGPASAESVELETNLQRFSYALGLRIGASMRNQGIEEVDGAALAAAVEDVLSGAQMRLTPEEMEAAGKAYSEDVRARRQAAAVQNQETGEAFLAKNKNAEGVEVTDSGLQYRVVEPGSGKSPGPSDTVVVHYRGKLLDGSEFDSSYRRNEPTELGVDSVIPGWQEALTLMKEGGVYEIWIPSELAYGSSGAGRIGPNETLHFDIELINVK